MRVTGHENRGTAEHPYGFVYFDDGKRVVYSGQTRVTNGTGGWDPITPLHQRLATIYLIQKGVLPAQLYELQVQDPSTQEWSGVGRASNRAGSLPVLEKAPGGKLLRWVPVTPGDTHEPPAYPADRLEWAED